MDMTRRWNKHYWAKKMGHSSVRLYKEEEKTLFDYRMSVTVLINEYDPRHFKGFSISGLKGQLLLERVAQICLQAWEAESKPEKPMSSAD